MKAEEYLQLGDIGIMHCLLQSQSESLLGTKLWMEVLGLTMHTIINHNGRFIVFNVFYDVLGVRLAKIQYQFHRSVVFDF